MADDEGDYDPKVENIAHIRHEKATRERYGLIGSGADLPPHVFVAWCGANGEIHLTPADVPRMREVIEAALPEVP